MGRYVAQRLVQNVAVVIGVLLIVFVLLRLAGDPTALLLPPQASAEQIALFRQRLGLDRPILEQFWKFLGSAVQGDLGHSYRYNQPALTVVVERIPATLQLAIVALTFSLIIAFPLGILAAVYRDSWVDRLSLIVSLLGQSMPAFWFGIVLILIFAVRLRLLPAFGGGEFKHLVLPAVTLGLYSAAITTRLLRSSLLDVLHQDYIRTARAKGLREATVLVRHALRNAGLPVLTVAGLQFGTLIGGAIVTETVFAYPGLGYLAIQSINNRDYPVIQAFVVVVSVVIALANLLVDILYTFLDPRIGYD